MNRTIEEQGITAAKSDPSPLSKAENYRLLFERARTPVVVIEENTIISLVNKSFTDLTGYSRDEVEGKLSFVDLLPDEEKIRLAEYHRRRRKPGGAAPHCYEARFRNKNGEDRVVEIYVDLIRETSQSVVYVEDLTERRQKEEDFQRQARTLSALHNISALTANRDPLNVVCSAGLDAALELTSTCGGAVFAPHRISQSLGVVTVENLAEKELDALRELLEEKRSGWSQEATAYTFRQYPLSADAAEESRDQKPESIIVFPLHMGPQNVAVLTFAVPYKEALPSHEENLLTAISNNLASAFRLHTLTHQQEEKISHLQILFNLGRAFASTLQLPELLEEIHRQLKSLMDVTNFYIALYDEARDEVSFEFEVDKGERRPHRSRRRGNGVTEYILRTGKPLLLNGDVMATCHELGLNPGGDPAKSWVGAPLLTEGKAIGVVAVQNYEREDVYSIDHIEVLSTVASQAAAAVQNARLYQGLQRRVKELDVINEVSARISAGLTLKQTLETIAEELGKIIACDSTRVYRFNEDRSLLVPEIVRYDPEAYPYSYEEVVRRMTVTAGQGLTGWVAHEGKPVIVNNGLDDQRTVNIPGTPHRDESLMGAPLVIDGTVEGVLMLAKLGLDQFSENDLKVLCTIGNQAAVALKNAGLFEKLRRAYDQLKRTQDKLLQSERKAAIIETVVAINHEINNPLAAIVGNAQILLLKPDELSPELKTRIDTILRESFRIKEVTEKLSSVSEAVSKHYPGGMKMLDIEKSSHKRQDDEHEREKGSS
jgi:PAS domain S-box-containing protein